MSTAPKLTIRGLARDPSGLLASQVGALRRAENVVIRAEGVAEVRPSFGSVVYEVTGVFSGRIKALREFDGYVWTIEKDGAAWSILNAHTDTYLDLGSAFCAPPDYDESETRFAEARGALHLTGAYGPVVVENRDDLRGRLSGVEPLTISTDYASPDSSTLDAVTTAWSYVFVRKRSDSNGYIRRSPPSVPLLCFSSDVALTCPTTTGTRFYICTAGPGTVEQGDEIEAYRTRVVAGTAPGTEHYLAWTHVVTSGEVSAGYFVPPDDRVLDDDLGAALYTNTAQGGIVSAKYPPPLCQQIAYWGRVMWFGDTKPRDRLTLRLANFWPHGIMHRLVASATFTAGATLVTGLTAAETGDMHLGEYVTDNLLAGPSSAGAKVPALTKISVLNPTTLDMSANALANGTVTAGFGTMSKTAPRGLFATTLVGTFTNANPTITGIADTTGVVIGMYISDAVGGPTVAGAKIPAGTTVLGLTGTTITMSANATAAGAGVSFTTGDYVTVDSVKFYAVCPATSPSYVADTWATAAQCFTIIDARFGRQAMMWAVTQLALAVNRYQIAHPTTFFVRAIASDSMASRWLSPLFGLPAIGSIGVTFERTDASERTPITFDCTAPAAFDPPGSENNVATRGGHLLYWSAPDEPEAVPLTNFVAIGAQNARILALVPLQNALLVFKEDGLYRVTGSAPSSWSIDQVDSTIKLARPEAVGVMNGTAYAWCDRGFFACDDGGVRTLSANCIDEELRRRLTYITSTTHGTAVIPWRERSLVLLCTPDQAGDDEIGTVYAWSATTQTFAEWLVDWSHAAPASGDAMLISRAPGSVVVYEVRRGGPPTGYDRDFTLDTADVTISGTSVSIDVSNCGQWVPVPGDFFVADGIARRIDSIAVVAGVVTLTLEAGFTDETPASVHALEAVQVVVEWHPTAEPAIPVGGICRELQVQVDFREAAGKTYTSTPRHVCGGTSELAFGTVTGHKALVAQIQPLRFGTPRAVARAQALAPYFATSDTFPVRINGVSLVYEGVSEKTTR